jgi:hypothetical protein
MYGDIRLLKSFYILATSLRTYYKNCVCVCVCWCKFDVKTIYGFDIEIIDYE